VALAYLGRADEAAAGLKAALAREPALSVSFVREKMYFLKRPGQLEFYLEGLRNAGAPL
jgi:hypothetical protein